MTEAAEIEGTPPQYRHQRRNTGFTMNQLVQYASELPDSAKAVWRKYSHFDPVEPLLSSTDESLKSDIENAILRRQGSRTGDWTKENKDEFEKEFVHYVECDAARSMYNCSNQSAYEASSKAVRDALVINWANTQQEQAFEDEKRVYYLSLEFLMGRAMDNAMTNIGGRHTVDESLSELGFRMEDVLEREPDAGLGNGGLGRLAACFMDSLSSRNYSGWGYGLNYRFGIFKQKIVNGYQIEVPDEWLRHGSPWEIERNEIEIPVRFYGYVDEEYDADGSVRKVWKGGQKLWALAFDYPIPGYKTTNCNNLRLFAARPTHDFEFSKFNSGDYDGAVSDLLQAESITAVLYPNDNFEKGKELRLKQQFFWVTAALHDICRRFRKRGHEWKEMPKFVAIQLNDTHPTIAVVEMMRILVDDERVAWDDAWGIVNRVFSYTNHTVMQEALEKWPVWLFERLLPRHLEIIYEINWMFLQEVSRKFPNDNNMLRDCSIIEEGSMKQVRMAYLAVIASHTVNGVAELHSNLVKTDLFPQYVKVFGDSKFTNVTNGITPRRWMKVANPSLCKLISETLNDPTDSWLTKPGELKKLEAFADDLSFLRKWSQVKIENKRRLAKLVKDTTGVVLDHNVLFDIQCKRIHEYKRQQLNIFAVIHRYLRIKQLVKDGVSIDEIASKYVLPKASIISGIAAPGYYMAKTIIHLANAVADVVNSDPEIGGLLKVVFLPGYNVSKAEILCPGSDLSNHISTAGTEGSGTSNMKFSMNGGLLIGTVDGANVEITREIGKENIFLFGRLANEVPEIRERNRRGVHLPMSLLEVFDAIDSGTFGSQEEFRSLLDSIRFHGDYYLVAEDFELFLEAHKNVDKEFSNGTDEEYHLKHWVKKCVYSVANSGFFSSDRAIDEYAERIWNIKKRF